MELRKKLVSVAALAFAAALSTGIAVSATAEENNTLDGFSITGYSVRTENFKDAQGVEVENSTGLRFKTETPDEKAAYDDAYTIITIAGAAEDADQAKVSAQVWRTADNGWNTVLLGIPAEAYGTEITAQSYVVLGGELYETEPVTISIDVAASQALNRGETADKLYDYTENAVESITLDQTSATLKIYEGIDLTETTAPTAGYGVVWTSSNPEVATVDRNGAVAGVSEGTATITATMSGVSATCEVTVTAEMATEVNFAGGNSLVFGGDSRNSVHLVENVGDERAVALTSTSSSLYYAFDADYVHNVFANEATTALQWRIYADGYEMSAHATHLSMYYVTDKGLDENGAQVTGGNSLKNDNANNNMAYENNDGYVTITFTRADYDFWCSASSKFFDDPATTHINEAECLVILTRLKLVEAESAWHNPGTYYIGNVAPVLYTGGVIDYNNPMYAYPSLLTLQAAYNDTTSIATPARVAFGDGYALGATFTSVDEHGFTLNYYALKAIFDATENVSAITFDVYTKNAPAYVRYQASTNSNAHYLLTMTSETVTGGTKTTLVFPRAIFEGLTEGQNPLFRFRHKPMTFFYIGSIGTTMAWNTTYDFETTDGTIPFAYVGGAVNNWQGSIKEITIGDTTTKVLAGTFNNGSTSQFPISNDYLKQVFADESVTHFQFDIIGNWPGNPKGTYDNLIIQANIGAKPTLAKFEEAEAVTIDGATFYRFTVRIDRATWETLSSFTTIPLRWAYGGAPSTVYFDNLKGVTIAE